MTLSEELAWRGFIHQTTLTNIADIDKQTWTFYHGFDASADSQTVGNLAGMMFDKVLMRHGNKAYILAGGATSLIGDPIWKDAERPLQDEATIAHNVACAEAEFKRIYKDQEFTLVNNLDWTRDLTVIKFLRDIGKHFSMTPLIQRDYMARRLGEGGSGITYTEFSYTLLQGMDFLHLFDEFGVTMQVGSSDQWGNCLSGVELIRRTRNAEAHVLTHPLVINKATGKKFGKSEAGAVWLDPEKTNPNEFFQFWINSDDEVVEDHLKIYTELDKPSVDEIMVKHRANAKERQAQQRLAWEVTKLVHSREVADEAHEYAKSLRFTTQTARARIVADSLKVKVGDSIVDALYNSNLASSRSEARQLLAENGVYINDKQTTREKFEASDFETGRLYLRRGKKLQNTKVVELDQ